MKQVQHSIIKALLILVSSAFVTGITAQYTKQVSLEEAINNALSNNKTVQLAR